MPRKGCQQRSAEWQPKLEFDYRDVMDNVMKELSVDMMFNYQSAIVSSLNATNPLTVHLKPVKVAGLKGKKNVRSRSTHRRS